MPPGLPLRHARHPPPLVIPKACPRRFLSRVLYRESIPIPNMFCPRMRFKPENVPIATHPSRPPPSCRRSPPLSGPPVSPSVMPPVPPLYPPLSFPPVSSGNPSSSLTGRVRVVEAHAHERPTSPNTQDLRHPTHQATTPDAAAVRDATERWRQKRRWRRRRRVRHSRRGHPKGQTP